MTKPSKKPPGCAYSGYQEHRRESCPTCMAHKAWTANENAPHKISKPFKRMDTGNLDVRDFTHALIAIKDAALVVAKESACKWPDKQGRLIVEPWDSGRNSLNQALGVLREACARLGATGAAVVDVSDDAGDAIREDAAGRDQMGEEALKAALKAWRDIMPFASKAVADMGNRGEGNAIGRRTLDAAWKALDALGGAS